ncbi:MAG TPA: metallophosphoesterase [Microlunatus sp.]|nr:metallophosphoesterase [Microlunatus sp.]
MSAAGVIGKTVLGMGAVGAGCLAYASLYEVDAYRLRRVEVPILPRGARPIRVLQIADLHLTPHNAKRVAWVSRLAGLEPDLVIDTGDNLAHPAAVPVVTQALGRLLTKPGLFVWGSNDYFAPTFKNPVTYLTRPGRKGREHPHELPWRDLGCAFTDAGWVDLTHRRLTLEINGTRLGFRGVDDAHLGRDQYALVAGSVDHDTEGDAVIGITHAPYRTIIDAMTYDGCDLVVAGHTHGGQVCVPFYGALVTNCDLDPARVKGLSTNSAGGKTAFLHVSAGLGTSPYAPFRFACRPEATLMTLVAQP